MSEEEDWHGDAYDQDKYLKQRPRPPRISRWRALVLVVAWSFMVGIAVLAAFGQPVQ